MYNYNKLRGRIVEKYGSIEKFADKLGRSDATVSKKLNNKSEFSRNDMFKWSALLEIPKDDFASFFFDNEVQSN